MTDRGRVVIEVAAGLADVLACRYVAEHTTMVFDDADTWVPGPGEVAGGVAHRPGGWAELTRGRVELAEVNWFDDQALMAAAPNAVWQAFVSRETEQPNLWLAYHPRTGLVEGSHLDHEVMVPATWADPGARSGDAERYLARIRAVQALLADPPPAPEEPVVIRYTESEAELVAEAAALDADPNWVAGHPWETGAQWLAQAGPLWVSAAGFCGDVEDALRFTPGTAAAYIAANPAPGTYEVLAANPPPVVTELVNVLRRVHVTVFAEVDDQARIHNWAICEPGAEPTDSDRPVWNPSTEEWEHTDGPEDAHVLTELAAALAGAPTDVTPTTTPSAGRPGVTAAVPGPVLLAQPATPGAAQPASHPPARGSGGRSLR